VKQRQGTRATTLRGYEWLIRQHIRPGLGSVRLDKLSPTDIRHLVERKAESGLSAQSVRLMHALIRNALADAEREELVRTGQGNEQIAWWRGQRGGTLAWYSRLTLAVR
jgi:Phage integrase, N-terminal SAM-like domain